MGSHYRQEKKHRTPPKKVGRSLRECAEQWVCSSGIGYFLRVSQQVIQSAFLNLIKPEAEGAKKELGKTKDGNGSGTICMKWGANARLSRRPAFAIFIFYIFQSLILSDFYAVFLSNIQLSFASIRHSEVSFSAAEFTFQTLYQCV